MYRHSAGITVLGMTAQAPATLRFHRLITSDMNENLAGTSRWQTYTTGGKRVKPVMITVLKTCYDEDLAETYLSEGRETGPCPLLQEGNTFIYSGGAVMPEGFCPWAWVDIYRGVSSLSAGGSYTPWNRQAGEMILCCTDGVRPVVFALRALEDDPAAD